MWIDPCFVGARMRSGLGATAVRESRAVVTAALGTMALLPGCGPSDQANVGDAQNLQALAEWAPEAPRDGNLRIATFNIRNFPRAEQPAPLPGEPAAPPPQSFLLETDSSALIEILAKLQFDAMAVEEIRDPIHFDTLLTTLAGVTGRTYASAFSQNASGNDQHVGIVVDTGAVRLAWTREHPAVDVKGTMRPGFSARIESVRPGGADFTMMVLHLASGDSVKRADLRVKQAVEVAKVVAAETQELGDLDYVVLGDLNTAREEAEFGGLDAALAGGTALAREDNPAGCTSYWIKNSSSPLVRPSWIDQIYVSSLSERDSSVPLVSGAHCFERSCQSFESTSPESGTSFFSVSDHCPVYFEIQDTDLD